MSVRTGCKSFRFAYLAYKMIVKSIYQFAHNTFVGFQLLIDGMEYSGYQPPRAYSIGLKTGHPETHESRGTLNEGCKQFSLATHAFAKTAVAIVCA